MDHDPVYVFNPRKKRRGPRKMSALQRYYFGGGRKRGRLPRRHNDPGPAPRRARSLRHVSRKRSHLRRRRNPPTLQAITSPIMNILTDGVAGTIGVQANNFVGNILASKALGVVGTKRSLVKVGTAVLVPGLLASFLPRWKSKLLIAGAAALAVEATKALNRHVYPQLGNVGQNLSTSDGEPAATGVPPASNLGYNSDVWYLPGGTFADRRSPPLGAYVTRDGRLSGVPGDQEGIYDSSPGVY